MGQCLACVRSSENVDTSNRCKEEITEIPASNPVISNMPSQFAQQQVLIIANDYDTINKNSSCNEVLNEIPSAESHNKEHIKNSFKIQSDSSQYSKLNQQSVSTVFNDGLFDTKINKLFNKYKDNTEDAILAEGIEELCNDLELNPDEFKVLILAWKLNVCQMCKFTRKEFVEGMKNMKINTICGIKCKLTELSVALNSDPESFKDLYRFTFKFGLDVASGQRILPVDVAVLLWRLVFTNNEPPILNKWLLYLEKNPQIRGIPKDTWYMFLNFCEFVKDDLSSYDDTEAWPSLFDDFVEYENDQINQNISKSTFN